MGACAGKAHHAPGQIKPTAREQNLAAHLARDSRSGGEPPFYAVPAQWMEEWQKFVTGGGPPPGPIGNADVVTTGDMDAKLGWVSADAWQILAKQHGGGPALRRWSRELLPAAPPAIPHLAEQGGSSASSSSDLEKRIRRAALLHEAWYQALRGDLSLEAERLEGGPWSLGAMLPTNGDHVQLSQARQKMLQAVCAELGGEELRSALRELRATSEPSDGLSGLAALVQGLCMHEEAQMVLACLLQALLDSDRLGLEMWLEQAEAMGLDGQSQGSPLLGPLNLYLVELGDQERRALEGHAAAARASEGPDARLWRLALFALEEDDEQSLKDVIESAKEAGLDSSAAELCMEELYSRRRKQKQEHPQPPGTANTSWTANANSRAAGPEWNDPTSWRTDDDFLEAFRRRKREDASQERGGSGRRQSHRNSQGRSSGVAARRSTGSSGQDASDEWWQRRRDDEDPEDPYARYTRTGSFEQNERTGFSSGSGQRPSTGARASAGPQSPYSGGMPRWDNPGEWTSTDDFLRAWRAKQERDSAEEARRKEEEDMRRKTAEDAKRRADRWRQDREAEESRRRAADDARRRAEQQQQQRQRQQQSARHSAAIGSVDGALSALGLPAGRVPPMAELKSAYRSMALRHHPDRPQNRGKEEEAKAEFQRVKAAFDYLASRAQ